jgi:hypothetical protein
MRARAVKGVSSSTWWARQARRVAHELGDRGYTDAELDAALEPLFAACIESVRLDEALACERDAARGADDEGEPGIWRALSARIALHRNRARRKRA